MLVQAQPNVYPATQVEAPDTVAATLNYATGEGALGEAIMPAAAQPPEQALVPAAEKGEPSAEEPTTQAAQEFPEAAPSGNSGVMLVAPFIILKNCFFVHHSRSSPLI